MDWQINEQERKEPIYIYIYEWINRDNKIISK